MKKYYLKNLNVRLRSLNTIICAENKLSVKKKYVDPFPC